MTPKKIFLAFVYLFAFIGFVLVAGFFAVKFGFTNVRGVIDEQQQYFVGDNATSTPAWAEGAEWQTFTSAVLKDTSDVNQAANLSGVPARLIVAQLVGEQLRLFYTERDLFKAVFAPLKILGDQSQFSWGVMGIKQETAQAIEAHLKDPTSPFYLGKNDEDLLDFKTNDPNSERFERITDENSRFYSYLYAGLYLKEVETQWKAAGFDISARPEILSTLFNIGFAHSLPNANPEVGGSSIEINGTIYSFGGLAAAFYYSDELITEFPRQ